jgi:glycosyltransferase involved in cell wall biosynthesis
MTPPSASPNGRLRVALAITELEVGGAERCLVNLALGLDRTRFEPEVYSLAPRPAEGKAALVKSLEAAGIPVHFVGVRRPWQFFFAVKRLKKVLTKQSPHVLQSFLFHANIVGALAARRAAVPVVVTGIRVTDPSRWRHRLERFVCRRVDRIVCVSQSVADFSHQTAGLPQEKIVTIPNGVDLSRILAKVPADLGQLGIPAGRRAIVCIGRLELQKGVDWLLPLMPDVFRQLPSYDLLVVGVGPQKLELERQASSLGIGQRVHFAGSQTDVPALLASCDLLVLPSRWEGMPNVLLEAMATGLPAVSANVAGVAEALGPLADHQAVDPGDADGFQRQIVGILQDPQLANQLGQQNRQRVTDYFSLDAMIAAYERLYESLAARV